MSALLAAIAELAAGRSLSEADAASAMEELMEGDATPVQVAGFMMGLRVKGETVDEIAGMARAARGRATPIFVDDPGSVLDLVGTGGDGTGTFNISTVSAIVCAGAGARVAKHGNRAASSRCGSADVLEALGIKLDLAPEEAAAVLRRAGITFLFAPVYHPSFRHAAVPRRELGVRTVFNILGPLCNPAGAGCTALGVADPRLVETMADVLVRVGVRRAVVFAAADGMDELSTSGPSRVVEVLDGVRAAYELDATAFGLAAAPREAVLGAEAAENAGIARAVLSGEPGPRRDIVLLNAAAGLRAAGIAGTWEDGIAAAAAAIDSGRAAGVLDAWVEAAPA